MVSSPSSPYDDWGDEIRVTTARSQRVPSIDFLSAAGRALPPDAPSRRWFRTTMALALSPTIAMVSSPIPPYDVGEMRSESRPRALNASRASTSSPWRGEHFLQTPRARHWFRTKMTIAPSPVIVMVSSPSYPYDVGEMGSESSHGRTLSTRPEYQLPLRSRASTSSTSSRH